MSVCDASTLAEVEVDRCLPRVTSSYKDCSLLPEAKRSGAGRPRLAQCAACRLKKIEKWAESRKIWGKVYRRELNRLTTENGGDKVKALLGMPRGRKFRKEKDCVNCGNKFEYYSSRQVRCVKCRGDHEL